MGRYVAGKLQPNYADCVEVQMRRGLRETLSYILGYGSVKRMADIDRVTIE